MPWLQIEQGSEAWLLARRGVVTGSRFKDCRDKLKSGQMSKECLNYAKGVARERLGGESPPKHQTPAMRIGTEQEAKARAMYEAETGHMVEEAGFYVTDDGLFGLSPDGLIDEDGVLEIKTLIGNDTLFNVLVEGDDSAYRDQCLGYLWLLGRKWVDLVFWVPDLDKAGRKGLHIVRIERDDDAIEKLEADLMRFAVLVEELETKLRLKAA